MPEKKITLRPDRHRLARSSKGTTQAVQLMETAINPLFHEMENRQKRFSWLDLLIMAGLAMVSAAAIVMVALIWELQPPW